MFVNAKQYLRQAYKLNERIKDKEDRIADLRLSASSVGSIDYSKEKVQSSPSGDAPFVKQTIMIIELEKKLQQDVNKLKRLKVEINQAIDEVEDINCSLLLSKRYIFMRTWEQIAEEMNYSVMQIHRIHKKALSIFKIPNNAQNEDM